MSVLERPTFTDQIKYALQSAIRKARKDRDWAPVVYYDYILGRDLCAVASWEMFKGTMAGEVWIERNKDKIAARVALEDRRALGLFSVGKGSHD